MKVFFDNNIFADISDNRNGYGKYKSVLLDCKRQDRIVVVNSLEVLNEILKNPKKEILEKSWAFFGELIDKYCTLKPSSHFWIENIKAICEKGMPSDPYVTNEYEFYSSIQGIIDRPSYPPDDLKIEFNKKLYKNISISDEILDIGFPEWVEGGVVKNSSFKEFWGDQLKLPISKSFPKTLLLNLIKEIAGYCCSGLDSGVEKCMKASSVYVPLAYVTQLLFNKYKYGKKEQKIYFDFKHLIHASAVGVFVTNDYKLITKIENIPENKFRVYLLKDFMQAIELDEMK